MVAGEVRVREAGDFAEIVFVDLAEQACDAQCVARVPDIVQHIREAGNIIGELQAVLYGLLGIAVG